MDVVITEDRRSGAPNMYWPHIWCLNQAVKRGVDYNEPWLYAALIIHCVDCSGAEFIFIFNMKIPKKLST
jgi:hypothetical protein